MLLPVYLTTLGFSPFEVGVQAGTALLGSALLTLAMSFLGVRYDHQLLLTSAAGFGFPVHTDYEGSDRHPLRCVSKIHEDRLWRMYEKHRGRRVRRKLWLSRADRF